MGRKDNKKEEGKAKEAEKDKKEEEEDEDTPVVKELKTLSDEYLEKAKKLEQDIFELRRKFHEDSKGRYEKRKEILTAAAEDGSKTGTPACKGFWCEALYNNMNLEELIQEWDKPVLEYLTDITVEEKDSNTTKATFFFAENPYFEHKELSIEVFIEENLLNGELETKKITADTVTWNADKDVTVEKTQKKVKGGGAKKAKQKAKSTIEPRDSFFRRFLCSFEKGKPCPEQLAELPDLADYGEDDLEEIVNDAMDSSGHAVKELSSHVLPYAVHWYTGEAVPKGYDDDEDEEEESEDDDDDDDDSDESDSPKGKKGAKKGAKDKKAAAGGKSEKQEECKQQ